MRIRRLDPTLANQIAAGEVVERPASVLKELLENSVDAGAERIEVEVEQGGARLVRVRDDGAGIHRDDLVLALRRHATSKIHSFEDLRQIMSLGFRGEALPSIASVSRLALVSRRAGEEIGWKVEAAGSAEVSEPHPAAHAPGTTVAVRDLFFNTPARRKFLRTEKTEFRHLESVLKILALGHPELDIALAHNGRAVFRVRGATSDRERDLRVARLCGRRFIEHALRVEFENAGLALRGWVAGPGLEPRASDPQYLFVNARAVRDPVVRHAIRSACAQWLPSDRPPAYVLDLALPATEIDVNVHPTKHEVRFRESRLVHDFVVRCLRGLAGGSLSFPEPAALPGRAAAASSAAAPPPAGASAASGGAAVADPRPTYAESEPPRSGTSAGGRAADEGRDDPPVLGPLNGRYAAVAAGGGIRLVDVAAARRYCLLARLEAAASRGALGSRPFLVPEAHALPAPEADRFETHEGLLFRLGFEFRRVGPERIMLREAPAALAGVAPGALTAALAAALPALDEAPGEERVGILLRRVVEHLEVPVDWPRVGALLREVDALRGASGSEPSGISVEVPGDAIAALFRRAERG